MIRNYPTFFVLVRRSVPEVKGSPAVWLPYGVCPDVGAGWDMYEAAALDARTDSKVLVQWHPADGANLVHQTTRPDVLVDKLSPLYGPVKEELANAIWAGCVACCKLLPEPPEPLVRGRLEDLWKQKFPPRNPPIR